MISGRIRPYGIPVPVPISTFNTADFGSSESGQFERSTGRWMSLALFLVVPLMELAASARRVSRSVRSLYSSGPRTS